MAEYIYGNQNKTHSWENVASIFAAHDSLHSAQTSSLPLVQFWNPQSTDGELSERAKDYLRILGFCTKPVANPRLYFEYAVPVYKNCGRGKASMTDLMILTDAHAIAIEAKWKECRGRYQTIQRWLGKEETEDKNKRAVLGGWIEYINDYLDQKRCRHIEIGKDDEAKIPYQLLHRIASACDVAYKEGKDAAVTYQLFYSENISEEDGWSNITSKRLQSFAEKLQNGYEFLFKHNVPIRFSIMKTRIAQGNDFGKAVEHCRIDNDWNELFLEMQQNKEIYKFPTTSELIFPKTKEA